MPSFQRHGHRALLVCTVLCAAVHASLAAPASAPAQEGAVMITLMSGTAHHAAIREGCWVQLYDERDFKGDAVTLLGPLSLQVLDRGAGRSLHRNLDSLEVGPKATLTVYEHRMFRDRSVNFTAGTREASLIKRLGFSGRIESLKVDCAS